MRKVSKDALQREWQRAQALRAASRQAIEEAREVLANARNLAQVLVFARALQELEQAKHKKRQ